MPSSQNIDRPEAAVAVAEQYLKRERPLSALVAVLVVSIFLGTFLVTSLLPAIIVATVSVIAVRIPLIQTQGTGHLRTDKGIETVVESFTGPTPPVLVFQWGIADDILLQDDTVKYHISYLFGLRSVEMAVQAETTTTQDGAYRVTLEATANGQSWSTYTVTIDERDGQTAIKYEYAANRRFGLRRLPQRLVAKRYRNKTLRAQGYTVVERDDQYAV